MERNYTAPGSGRPVLECRNLTKFYGKTPALRNVNLSLESGRIVGLVGPNGSGKTTLIKLAQHLLTPTEGEILIAGLEPGPETKSIVSYLPDRDFLPQWMNLEGLINFVRSFSNTNILTGYYSHSNLR